MKNRTLVTKLRQFSPELKVAIKAYLQYGCTERGSGFGDYDGYRYRQDFTTEWNDGELEATQYDCITVGDVIKVLLKKPLSKIGSDDFSLSPGNLMNGNTDHETSWEDSEPEDAPDDYDLYMKMELGGSKYEWEGATAIDFEIYYMDDYGEESTISYTLNEDEVDRKPDSLEEKNNKSKAIEKSAKKKNRITSD
jgi:hypothetical protein